MIQKKQVDSKVKIITERRNATQNITSGILFADFVPLEIAQDINCSAWEV